MTVYKKELARVLKSLVFLLTAFGIVVFIYSQGVFPPSGSIAKPEPGMQNYGMKASSDPKLIMPEAADSLFREYSANEYTTYPHGFIKNVRLGQSDKEKMSGIIAQLSIDTPSEAKESGGIPPSDCDSVSIAGDHLQQNADGSFQIMMPDDVAAPAGLTGFVFNANITWERFYGLMQQADELLGGGSDYSETWISHRFGHIAVTYEEALADYKLAITSDRYSGAHARLFSDYAGIILALLPVFPAAFLCLKDRRSIAPMLYTRRVSSSRLIISRYLALVTATMLPIFLMGAVLTIIHGAEYGFSNIDLFAYVKYMLLWLLPTAMASTAIGFFFTTLTGTPIAVAVQLVWWFVDTMGGSSAYSFFGTRLLQLIPRHNALGETGAYLDYLPNLIQNRICIALIAIALVALTVAIFSMKRRGFLHAPVHKHRKMQSEI